MDKLIKNVVELFMCKVSEFKVKEELFYFVYSIIIIEKKDINDAYQIYPDGVDYIVFSSKGYHSIIRKSNKVQTILQDNEELIILRLKPYTLFLLENYHSNYFEVIFFLTGKLFETKSVIKQQSWIKEYLFEPIKNIKNKQISFISSLIDYIYNVEGSKDVKDIVEKVDVNSRTLERRFKNFIDLSPKEYINIIRFQSIITRRKILLYKKKTPNKNWITDYSHLYKIFKAYTNISPKIFFKTNNSDKYIKSIYDIY